MRARAMFPFYHLRGSSQLDQVLLAAGGSKGFLSLLRFPLHLNFHRNQWNNTAAFLHKFSDLPNQSGKFHSMLVSKMLILFMRNGNGSCIH